jgi:hypothetical protein
MKSAEWLIFINSFSFPVSMSIFDLKNESIKNNFNPGFNTHNSLFRLWHLGVVYRVRSSGVSGSGCGGPLAFSAIGVFTFCTPPYPFGNYLFFEKKIKDRTIKIYDSCLGFSACGF